MVLSLPMAFIVFSLFLKWQFSTFSRLLLNIKRLCKKPFQKKITDRKWNLKIEILYSLKQIFFFFCSTYMFGTLFFMGLCIPTKLHIGLFQMLRLFRRAVSTIKARIPSKCRWLFSPFREGHFCRLLLSVGKRRWRSNLLASCMVFFACLWGFLLLLKMMQENITVCHQCVNCYQICLFMLLFDFTLFLFNFFVAVCFLFVLTLFCFWVNVNFLRRVFYWR